MAKQIYTRIIGTGSYLPSKIVGNQDFMDNQFFDGTTKKPFDKSNEEIIQKFQEITNIDERRYAADNQLTSDLAVLAVQDACNSSGVSLDSLDFIIVSHNFGDIKEKNVRIDVLPSLANKVKMKLKIQNPACICHDVISGCPGWTQSMIVADAYIKSGTMKRGVVVGADVLSRISDPHDIDSMIYSDGSGAVILEAKESETPVGVIAHLTRSDTVDHVHLLKMDVSYNPEFGSKDLFLKMNGRKLYEYALNHVP